MRSGMTGRTKVFLGVLLPFVLSALIPASRVYAQLHSLDVSQYLHTSWTAQEGYFPGAGVTNNGIVQTADGYLWILSANGLFRFDGVRFVEWEPPDGQTLPGAPPTQLLASKDGSLWIGGHGVAQLRPDGTWHRFRELDVLNHVRLAEDKDHVIWVSAETSPTPKDPALFRIDHGKVDPYREPSFIGMGIAPLFTGQDGKFWAGSDKGIWRLSPGPPELAQTSIHLSSSFGETATGDLLYVERGRIRKLSSDGTSADYLGKLEPNPLNVRTMMRDREGGLWIGTFGQGIVHLHEGRIDHFTSADGLSSDTVESIFEDREGNVWATTPESVEKFTRPAVPKLTRKQGLSGEAVYSVLVDQSDRAWVGTSDGFNEIVGARITRPDFQSQNDEAQALVETRTGRLIMTTRDRGELPGRGRMTSGIGGNSWLEGYKNLFWFAEDRAGTLWAVSQQLGLLHLRPNGELIEEIHDPKWGDYPLSVAYDPKRDGVWFSLHNGKLMFSKGGKILEQYGRSDGIAGGLVRIVNVDSDGAVWIASSRGLGHLKDGKIHFLGAKNGLPCDRVHWMQRDRYHQVWLYTACGLVGFSEDELAAWSAEPSHSITITHYLDNTEGVENTSVSGWYSPQNAITKDGRILFPMRTGLGVLDPLQLNENSLPPPVHIERLTADTREVPHADHASLPPRTGAIHIAYTALSFVAPRKVQFRYRLEGYDNDWSPPVTLREVTYTNLPPGSYRFRVIACNNDGVWNNQGATFSFFVQPSWYQTLWFRVLGIVIVLVLGTALYYRRVHLIERELNLRFEERMGERMRIARELHDTLLQALQGLMLNFSSFSSRVTASPEVQREIEQSLDRAEQLVVSGRERIRDLRQGGLRSEGLMEVLPAIIDQGFGESGSEVNVVIEGEPKPLNEDVQEEAIWIVKEALANARRHSGADEIDVLIAFNVRGFRIAVKDNGCGLRPDAPTAANSGHFGLAGMRERSETVGGRLVIQSSPSEGTSVEFTVPSRIAYTRMRERFRKSWFHQSGKRGS